jgi:hypothetical protein
MVLERRPLISQCERKEIERINEWYLGSLAIEKAAAESSSPPARIVSTSKAYAL